MNLFIISLFFFSKKQEITFLCYSQFLLFHYEDAAIIVSSFDDHIISLNISKTVKKFKFSRQTDFSSGASVFYRSFTNLRGGAVLLSFPRVTIF